MLSYFAALESLVTPGLEITIETRSRVNVSTGDLAVLYSIFQNLLYLLQSVVGFRGG